MKAIRLLSLNHNVEVVYVNRSNRWLEQDKTILFPENVRCHYLNLGRKPLWPWFTATALQKLSQLVYPFFNQHIDINAFASNKSSIMLRRFQSKMRNSNFDLIAGHGGGALYPAWQLSNKWNIPFLFDVEDYHPGEFIRHDAKNEKQRREYLMKKLLPEARAITSASPLIGEYTLKLIGGHPNHQVILNSFPETEFIEPNIRQGSISKLRLVWFSQTINFGRGLEQLFDAFRILDSRSMSGIELTLIGEMDKKFYDQVISPTIEGMKDFTFQHLPPMSQAALHAELPNHDIGLALEFDATDLNRQLCITNKILAYVQAGLYTLATDTPAQREFIVTRSWAGEVCGQTVEDISHSLVSLLQQAANIRSCNKQRFQKASDLSWEKESRELRAMLEIA